MSTVERVCEVCGEKAHRFANAKTAQQRKLRRMRLCDTHAKRWTRNARLETLPAVVNPEQQAAIESLYADGEGASSIARTLGIPRMRVHRRLLVLREAAESAG